MGGLVGCGGGLGLIIISNLNLSYVKLMLGCNFVSFFLNTPVLRPLVELGVIVKTKQAEHVPSLCSILYGA